MDKNLNYNEEQANEVEEDDTCQLDPNKICDNCFKCLEPDKDYKIIKITKIIK